MKKRIAVGGSAADPPHLGHLALLEQLLNLEEFDQIIWILSGFSDYKNPTVSPDDRVAMTELMIPKNWRLKSSVELVIRYDDVYGSNTTTIKWLKKLQKQFPQAELVWYTGADSIVPRQEYEGRCEIEALWHCGRELMSDWQFLIVSRQGYAKPDNLPDNFKLLDVKLPDIASSHIRKLITGGNKFDHLVTKEVAEYIKLRNLYHERRCAQ
jgi:nicotinate-nucleotide adenylyltransferase